MLQKDQEEPQEPRQSGSFKALQEFVDSDGELFLFFRWCMQHFLQITQYRGEAEFDLFVLLLEVRPTQSLTELWVMGSCMNILLFQS